MDCPRCENRLQTADAESAMVTIDCCLGCGGSFLDRGELDRLDESLSTNAEASERWVESPNGHEGLACPKCTGASMTSMSPREDASLIVDRCGSCGGFWLDAGELERIQQMTFDDASSSDDFETFVRPAGWSAVRWWFYCLKRSI